MADQSTFLETKTLSPFRRLPFHSVASIFIVLRFPSSSRNGRQVLLGGPWASPVGSGTEPRTQKHFGIFWGKEMCVIATIGVLFVETTVSIWNFWTKLDTSSDYIIWGKVLIQCGSRVHVSPTWDKTHSNTDSTWSASLISSASCAKINHIYKQHYKRLYSSI